MGPLFLGFIPLGIVIVGHFMYPTKVNRYEIIIAAAISILLGYGLYALGKTISMTSTEIWNGEITGTSKSVVYYRNVYTTCNSKGKNCRTRVDEGHNMNWYAQSNLGRFTIRHVNCSSAFKGICNSRYPDPSRWLNIRVGDPVSRTHHYLNYVKAADYGLFNRSMVDGTTEKYPELEYPIRIYDHYRINRVLLDGVDLPNAGQWNMELSNILRTLGPQRQANMILVLTNATNPSYADMLIDAWEGANKNDIVITAGFPSGNVDEAPNWVSIHSWAKYDIFNVTLRDELLANPEWWLSPTVLFTNVQQITMDTFERRPMKEFEYLKDEITPSWGIMIMMSIIGALFGTGMVYLSYRFDLFNTGDGGDRLW